MNVPDEVKALIQKSGNNFQCEVIRYLRKKGWYVTVSPYYMDEAANKPREIDIIAEKFWEPHGEFGTAPSIIVVRLFIECKYIPDFNIFWFEERDPIKSLKLVISEHGLRENNSFTNQHHYLANDGQVAKLFASKNNPQTENEPIYKAMNQCLNGTIYLRNLPTKIPEITRKSRKPARKIDMPVVLCHSFDKFYRLSMNGSSSVKKVTELFQLEVNYAFVSKQDQTRSEEYFLIDVVSFKNIDDYLNAIDKDIEIIGIFLN